MNMKVAISSFFLLLFGGLGLIVWNNHLTRFDSERWKTAELYGASKARQRMVEDLLQKFPLSGMSEEEVHELLGPQSDPTYFKAYDLRYWLGPERGLGVDSEWLVIRLNDGRVAEYRIVTD